MNGSNYFSFLNGGPYLNIATGSASIGTGLFGDGTAAAPSISFLNYPATGIYSSAANEIAFSLNGTQRWILSGSILRGTAGAATIDMPAAGSIALSAGGTNQPITLTGSGGGPVIIPGGGGLTITNGGCSSVGGYTTGNDYTSSSNGFGGPNGSLSNVIFNNNQGHSGAKVTGIYFPATDAVGVAINGTLNTTFDASGITQGGTAAAANTCTRFVKSVTAIANAVATAVATVTIPNAAHAALIRLTLKASLGAGGTIGACEAVGDISYDICVTRTAGVNAVAGISTAYGTSNANVAGGTTLTVTAANSAISGAVGATNTFTINVTITRGAGTSTNHTCQILAELLNANASGITIA